MPLFLVPVLVVYPDEGTSEGQYLAEGDEYAMVYLRQRRKDEARREHYAPEGAQRQCDYQLNVLFHNFLVF